MLLNPTELCKICKGEHFTFEGAGNADVHFQLQLTPEKRARVFSTHAYVYIYKKILPIYANC